jgi:hypothetical protein
MFYDHPAAGALRAMGAFTPPKPLKANPILDGCGTGKRVLDAATAEAMSAAELGTLRAQAVATLMQWCETEPEDLDNGENMADRLFAMFVGIADDNKDGEISDDEAAVIEIAMTAAADYMEKKGVSSEDVDMLLNEGDNDVAERVCEFMRSVMPDGEDESMEDVDAFAFDAESQEPLMDSVLDAVYKKSMVIRKGKKVRINKRVAGAVRLTAGQKMAVRKASRKSQSASAKMKRMRSMNVRKKMGL